MTAPSDVPSQIKEALARLAIESAVTRDKPLRALALSTAAGRAIARAMPALHPIAAQQAIIASGWRLGFLQHGVTR